MPADGEVRDSKFDSYLRSVISRLDQDRFRIERETTIGAYRLDMFAFKHRVLPMGANIDCYVSFHGRTSPDLIDEYTTTMYDHAIHYGMIPLETCIVVAVIASTRCDSATIEHVKSYRGWRRIVPYIAFPILAELETREVYSNSEEVAKLGFVLKAAVEVAGKYFSFSK